MAQKGGGWSHVLRRRGVHGGVESSNPQLLDAISGAIEAHGASWLESDGAVSHSFVSAEERPRSVIAVVDVHCRNKTRRVLAKAVMDQVIPDAPTRPRIIDLTAPADRLAAEFSALSHITELPADDRFFAVSPLGFFTDPPVLVMEWSDAIPLTRHLMDAEEDGADRLMNSVGAWLKRFHQLDAGQTPAYEHHVDLPRLFRGFRSAPGAGRRLGPISRLQSIALDRVSGESGDVPLGSLHGDMAPRNFLIDSNGRVGGIDVSMRWKAPVLHDLAAFWLSLRVGRLRARDPRAIRADGWFESFLQGYGLEPRLRPSLDIYRALLLVDRAAAASTTIRRLPETILLTIEAGGLISDLRDD